MATTGTAEIDFGAFPGAADASVAVTGQTGITGTSLVEAWLALTASTDHSADEHRVESIRVTAGNISAGVGFTIYARNDNMVCEPPTAGKHRKYPDPCVYGKWKVNWVWN